MPSQFMLRLESVKWPSTTTTVERVSGFTPVYPKVGEKLSIDEIFMLVRNGNEVIILPPISNKKGLV